MLHLVQMLEKLAVSTQSMSERGTEIDQLAQSFELNEELVEAIQQSNLTGLIQLAGLPGRGCFAIVAPDSPEEPDDEDEPNDDKKIRKH